MIGIVGLVNAILGVGLLVAGRKLFWLFVAAAGFVLGAQIVIRSFNGPEWLGLVVGIVVGILFAGLAVFLRAAAIGIAGFIAGASILAGLVELFNGGEGFSWLAFIIGGVIGIILISLLFNWALILLSSLGGAALLVRELVAAGTLPAGLTTALFVILAIVGIVIQAAAMSREKRHG